MNGTFISEMSTTRMFDYFSLMNLTETTRTGFSTLQESTHTDLTDLTTNLTYRLMVLEQAMSEDLYSLQYVLDTDLKAVKATVQATASTAEKGAAARLVTLRDELRGQVSSLRDSLRSQLMMMQKAASADAGGVMGTTSSELQKVQGALWSIRGEQNTHSWRLGQIADKDLSVSVQSFAFVNNQINVVIDKSTFK